MTTYFLRLVRRISTPVGGGHLCKILSYPLCHVYAVGYKQLTGPTCTQGKEITQGKDSRRWNYGVGSHLRVCLPQLYTRGFLAKNTSGQIQKVFRNIFHPLPLAPLLISSDHFILLVDFIIGPGGTVFIQSHFIVTLLAFIRVHI